MREGEKGAGDGGGEWGGDKRSTDCESRGEVGLSQCSVLMMRGSDWIEGINLPSITR